MRGIAVGSESDFAACEAVHVLERGIIARFPSLPNAKRSLSFVDVTGAFNAMFSVNFVATVDAVAANQTIQARSDCGHGIFRFAEYPNLEHVTGFPVFRGGFEARGDDDADGVFMKEKAVQRTPPTRNSATQSAMAEITRNAPIKSARAVRKGLRGFMRIYRPVNQAMRKVDHSFARNATERVKENYLS